MKCIPPLFCMVHSNAFKRAEQVRTKRARGATGCWYKKLPPPSVDAGRWALNPAQWQRLAGQRRVSDRARVGASSCCAGANSQQQQRSARTARSRQQPSTSTDASFTSMDTSDSSSAHSGSRAWLCFRLPAATEAAAGANGAVLSAVFHVDRRQRSQQRASQGSGGRRRTRLAPLAVSCRQQSMHLAAVVSAAGAVMSAALNVD